MERKEKNTSVQGTNADMRKIAMRLVWDRLRAAGIDGPFEGLVACVQGEIVLEVQEDRADESAATLVECMTAAGEVYLKACPVKAEVGVVDAWEK